MGKRKTWREKLETASEAKVFEITPDKQQRFGSGIMVIPKALDVEAVMKTVPKGKLVTQQQIRDYFAEKHNADNACPITTGIFIRISAEAAEDEARDGKKKITPYWRVLKNDGALNEKFPGGIEAQSQRLIEEGHEIEKGRGKKVRVKDYQKKMVSSL